MNNHTTGKYKIIGQEFYLQQLQAFIDEATIDPALFEVDNFEARADCIEFLDAELSHVLYVFSNKAQYKEQVTLLAARAKIVHSKLKGTDNELFKTVRAAIRSGRDVQNGFRNLLNKYTGNSTGLIDNTKPQYGTADSFMNGLFTWKPPTNLTALEPEMVYYQKTPALVILQLGEQMEISKDDVFIDIGAGPGHTAILFHLLYGTRVKGIECVPSLCAQAVATAAALRLTETAFIHVDARCADYSTGTIFFMFTPFFGQVLLEVLHLLHTQAGSRKIKVVGYGPCITVLASQSWLVLQQPVPNNVYQPAIFESY